MTIRELLGSTPVVINVGAGDFHDALVAQGAEVVAVDWRPPRKVDPEIERLLEQLL